MYLTLFRTTLNETFLISFYLSLSQESFPEKEILDSHMGTFSLMKHVGDWYYNHSSIILVMKKILLLFWLIQILFLVGCESSKCPCSIVDTNVEITYKNAKGQDLLNPSTSGYYSVDSFHVFNVENEIKKKLIIPIMTFPIISL